jgi:hypothetical protein
MHSKIILTTLAMGAGALTLAGQTQQTNTNSQDQQATSNQSSTTGGDQTQPATQDQPEISTGSSSVVNQGPAAAALDTANVVKNINQASFDNRTDAIKDLRSHMGKAHGAVLKTEIKDVFHTMSDDQKNDYKSAREAEKNARTELKARVKDAENATAENWETSRNALAQAYQQYSEAAARLDSFAPARMQNQAQDQTSGAQK